MKTRHARGQSSAKAKWRFRRVPREHKRPRQRKSHLTATELEEFRGQLLTKRYELIGDVDRLCDEALGGSGSRNSNGSSLMPIHMADRASDTWEQGMTLGVAENTASLLREIEAALRRIKDRTYGICEVTGEPISKARLRAIPWTRYCIEYALKLEAG